MERPFPAYKGDDPYIFVSYSHKDASVVFPELSRLREQGFKLWFDEGIEAGTEWREEIAQAIRNARLFLYYVTPQSVHSENCRKEVNFAVEDARVGQMTDYDRLLLDVWTKGSIVPEDAVREAADLLIDHFMTSAKISLLYFG